MISPRFDVNEKTLPVQNPDDYADTGATDLKVFSNLQPHIGIIGTSA
jgi:hypothetical protein